VSLRNASDLSRRDCRTQPGVLTPGGHPNREPPYQGGRDRFQISLVRPMLRNAYSTAPFWGGRFFDRYPGVKTWLKPRAESYSPFGTKSDAISPLRCKALPLLISQQTGSNVLDTVYIDVRRVWRRGAVRLSSCMRRSRRRRKDELHRCKDRTVEPLRLEHYL